MTLKIIRVFKSKLKGAVKLKPVHINTPTKVLVLTTKKVSKNMTNVKVNSSRDTIIYKTSRKESGKLSI